MKYHLFLSQINYGIIENKASISIMSSFCEQYAIPRFSLEVVWENCENVVTKYL